MARLMPQGFDIPQTPWEALNWPQPEFANNPASAVGSQVLNPSLAHYPAAAYTAYWPEPFGPLQNPIESELQALGMDPGAMAVGAVLGIAALAMGIYAISGYAIGRAAAPTKNDRTKYGLVGAASAFLPGVGAPVALSALTLYGAHKRG